MLSVIVRKELALRYALNKGKGGPNYSGISSVVMAEAKVQKRRFGGNERESTQDRSMSTLPEAWPLLTPFSYLCRGLGQQRVFTWFCLSDASSFCTRI